MVAIYSTFLQRAYDQLIHDVASRTCRWCFALDRAGLVGADGATTPAPTTSPTCAASQHQRGLPGRRERVPPAAEHRLCAGPPGGGALPARRGAGYPAAGAATLPFGKGESAARAGHGHPGLWHAAVPGAEAAEAWMGATVVNMRWAKLLDRIAAAKGAQPRGPGHAEEAPSWAVQACGAALEGNGPIPSRCCSWA